MGSLFSIYDTQNASAGFSSGDRIQVMENLMTELSETSSTSTTAVTDAEFALPWVRFTSSDNGDPVLIDMNGDGLTDVVYSKPAAETLQYVLLNTGDGFEVAYSCYYSDDYGTPYQYTYRGTCADL